MKITRGSLGWSNRRAGLEAYGPGGRWQNGPDGDLLGSTLADEGRGEGAILIVVSFDRQDIRELGLTTMAEVEAFVLEAQSKIRGVLEG